MELYNEVKGAMSLSEDTRDGIPELSAYHTQARYPNAGLRRPSIEIGRAQSERALKIAKGVLDAAARESA